MEDIPDLALLHIFSFLSPQDLLAVGSLSSRLRTAVTLTANTQWAHWCREVFDCNERGHLQTWYEVWLQEHRNGMGRYVSVNIGRIRRALREIEAFFARCAADKWPGESPFKLLPGLSEDALDEMETTWGGKLPLVARCQYRLCAGQAKKEAAMLGMYSFYNAFGQRSFFPLQHIGPMGPNIVKSGRVPLALHFANGSFQLIWVSAAQPNGEVKIGARACVCVLCVSQIGLAFNYYI
jgi:hypothetical protein